MCAVAFGAESSPETWTGTQHDFTRLAELTNKYRRTERGRDYAAASWGGRVHALNDGDSWR
jgi:hypothetical protein